MSSKARSLLPACASGKRVVDKVHRTRVKRSGLCWRLIGLVLGPLVLFLSLNPMSGPAASAQSPITWTKPLVLSQAKASWSRPTVAVDPWGRVHVIWSDIYGDNQVDSGLEAEKGDTLYHAWWDGQSWSEPLDILFVEAERYLTYPYVKIDADGQIYLIWSSISGLHFSQAPALDAHNAASWQPPQVVVKDLGVDQSCLVVGSGGRLHVVYAKLEGDLGGNVAYTWSADKGVTWSLPQAVSEVYPGEYKASGAPQIVLDERGWLHVVWAERSAPSWLGHRILYARSKDAGEAWTSPESLAELQPGEGWAESPSLVATKDGKLHLVWLCEGGSPYRCYRSSNDGGYTWSARERILDGLVGRGGWDVMVGDHESNLHLIALLRYPSGVYYAHKLADEVWGPPVLMVSGSGLGASGHFFQAALAEGNQLHAVWQKSSPEGDVVYVRVTTLASPITSLATLTPTLPVRTTPDHQAPSEAADMEGERPDRTPPLSQIGDGKPAGRSALSGQALLWGIVPVVALIMLTLGLQLKR